MTWNAGAARLGIALGILRLGSGCTGVISGNAGPNGTATAPSDSADQSSKACDSQPLLPPRLVRLASSELRDHVRRALPGIDEALIQSIDLQADHITPISERVISSADFAAYYQAALSAGESYIANGSEAEPCRAGSNDTCLDVVNAAVTRLYRRPATAEESASLTTSFQLLLATQGAVLAAAGVVAGALLSPQLLFHTELTQPGTANGGGRVLRETALELARFALTGEAPDPSEVQALDALSDAEFPAALGKLAAAWTQAMEFQTRALDFAEVRFGVEHLAELSRSDTAFSSEMKAAMTGEFREYVAETLLVPGGTFAALFTQKPSRVFPGLESLYTGGGADRRQGVLGLASLLAARAAPDGSDPVKRGLMVRGGLLCESVPPPIAGASFDKVTVTPEMQTRERFEALASMSGCAGCHQTINPPGYLFEEFDQLGRHRDSEKGRPINAHGSLPAPFDGEAYPGVGDWDGIVPLANWMSTAPEARECFAANFASYVMSEAIPNGVDNCALPAITARFLESGRIDELAEDLVKSDLFLSRSPEAP